MIPVSICWLLTLDWRVGLYGVLGSAVIAVLGFGAFIALRPVYIGVGILSFVMLFNILQAWSDHELHASLEELRENPMSRPEALSNFSQITNGILAICAVAVGFVAIGGVLGWAKLFRRLRLRPAKR
jgi:hypothetical protein